MHSLFPLRQRLFRNPAAFGSAVVCVALIVPCLLSAEPIVLTGKMVPTLIGKSVTDLRVTNHAGASIPFQIDQIVNDDYVCPSGKEPNSGSGLLDTCDEIVFLWEDADTVEPHGAAGSGGGVWIRISHGIESRYVYLVVNAAIPPSTVSYMDYDDNAQLVTTPYYYATFGRNRFHFTRAGIMDFAADKFVNVTNELRVKIFFRALWGLLPITYTENNMICFVKRYKTGPIRLIRRGDFHLNIGMFIQGSRAVVNQICYPQLVRVPVYVHLPFKFKSFFSEAYIEMTPVLRQEAADFSFRVTSHGLCFPLGAGQKIDTLVPINPNRTCMLMSNSTIGYGWLLDAAMDTGLMSGSGYCVKIPSEREGVGQCGFRLGVRDLPKGNFLIGNWVLFSKDGAAGLPDACDRLSNMAAVAVEGNAERLTNQLDKIFAFRKR
jgi:hypothetical protein